MNTYKTHIHKYTYINTHIHHTHYIHRIELSLHFIVSFLFSLPPPLLYHLDNVTFNNHIFFFIFLYIFFFIFFIFSYFLLYILLTKTKTATIAIQRQAPKDPTIAGREGPTGREEVAEKKVIFPICLFIFS